MSDYSERTVRIGGMSYIDPEGRHQFALGGAKVRVHPDNVERFDSLNGDPSSPVPTPEPTVPEPVSAPEPVAPIKPAPREPVGRRGPGRPRKAQSEE